MSFFEALCAGMTFGVLAASAAYQLSLWKAAREIRRETSRFVS